MSTPVVDENLAVAEIVRCLSTGHEIPGKPTVPMPGGHGTLFTEARHWLCDRYLYAFSPAVRAYAVLGAVGERTESGSPPDRWQGKEFKLVSSRWFEQFPINVNGTSLANVVAPSDRWKLMLRALYQLAQRLPDAGVYCDNAQARCKDETDDPVGPLRAPAGYAISRAGELWDAVNRDMVDSVLRARLLAGYFMHTLCAELFIVAPERKQKKRAFFVQLRALMEAVYATPSDPGSEPACQDDQCSRSSPVAGLRDALLSLELLEGSQPMTIPASTTGAQYPDCFGPYSGGPRPRLDLLLERMDSRWHDDLKGTHQLAILLADKLMDPMQVRLSSQPGVGFSASSYVYLLGLMTTTRIKQGWGNKGLPRSEPRLMVQRLFKELQDERYAKRVSTLLENAKVKRPLAEPGCASCDTYFTGLVPTRGLSPQPHEAAGPVSGAFHA